MRVSVDRWGDDEYNVSVTGSKEELTAWGLDVFLNDLKDENGEEGDNVSLIIGERNERE